MTPTRGASWGLAAQEAEVAAGDLDAVGHLAGDDFEALLDKLEVFHRKLGRVANPLADELNEAGDDGQRAVDIVDDAGVDLGPGFGELLVNVVALELGQELLEPFGVAADFALQGAAMHRVGHGRPHCRDVERLVDVIAGAEPQGLAHGFAGLEGRHHDDLDAGVHGLETFQQFDSRHAGHADIQDGDIDFVVLGQLDGGGPVGSHPHFVLVLENDVQRLPRPFLVVHHQECALPGGGWRLGTQVQ